MLFECLKNVNNGRQKDVQNERCWNFSTNSLTKVLSSKGNEENTVKYYIKRNYFLFLRIMSFNFTFIS